MCTLTASKREFRQPPETAGGGFSTQTGTTAYEAGTGKNPENRSDPTTPYPEKAPFPDGSGSEIARLKEKLRLVDQDRVARGKLLRRVREAMVNIDVEDEGDRVYFASSNDADVFDRLKHKVDAWGWDEIMREGRLPDLVAECRKANARSAEAEAALQAIIDEMTRERKAICEVLGCVDLPGIPLKFVKEQRDRLSKAWQREVELLRSWDDATITERQELDRMRRGWGPTTPTERMRRQDDVRAAMHCLSSALNDLTLSEEEAEAAGEEVNRRLDEAYQRIYKQYVATIAILRSMDEPIPRPDLDAEASS